MKGGESWGRDALWGIAGGPEGAWQVKRGSPHFRVEKGNACDNDLFGSSSSFVWKRENETLWGDGASCIEKRVRLGRSN